MATRNTNTSLTDSQGNNQTKTHLSTNIIIKVDGNVISTVQDIDYEERADIKKVPEVGTDGFVDIVRNSNVNVSGTCSRIRWGGMRIAEAFSRGFLHVGSQRIGFDIEFQDIFISNDATNAIITTLSNCWISSISTAYAAGEFVITDKMNFEARGISSVLNSGNVVQAVANGRQFPIILNQFEQEADRGAFTGALDAAGLMNAFLQDPRN